MKKLILLMAAVLTAVSAYAHSFEEVAAKIDRKACDAVENPKSALNKGAEPFRVFLKKFCSDKKFRDSRLKLPYSDVSEFVYELLIPKGMEECEFPVEAKYWQNIYSYSTWQDATADSVVYYSADDTFEDYVAESDDVDEETGGGTLSATFKRIGGRWYLVDIMFAG
ncbi:MAG: hypothetical protein J6L73_06555 [Muribaculaceae bacterium]|nr:hypothetical protein [Muribaculaceae bacterium]